MSAGWGRGGAGRGGEGTTADTTFVADTAAHIVIGISAAKLIIGAMITLSPISTKPAPPNPVTTTHHITIHHRANVHGDVAMGRGQVPVVGKATPVDLSLFLS